MQSGIRLVIAELKKLESEKHDRKDRDKTISG